MSAPPPIYFYGFTTDDANTPAPFAFNTKVMVGAIIVLFLVIFFIVVLHFYARWFLRRSSGSYVISRGGITFSSLGVAASTRNGNTGLDKAAISQLPTFLYTATSPVDNLAEADEACTECAVCLSEFQENEKVRMLPSCKHIFHTDCIDMWLFSHSTCPLCRTKAIPAMATSASTHQQNQGQEAIGTPEGNPEGSHAVEYPCDVLFWGNQTHVDSSQDPSSSSLPLRNMPGSRALPQISIDIPPIEGNVLVSASGHLSAKCTTEQEASSSQPLKSPGFRASIKRILSRQSSRHKSEESPK